MPIKTLIIYCLNSTDQSITFYFHQVFHILSYPSQSIKPECKISDSLSGFPKVSDLGCSAGWQILNISENHVAPSTVQDEGIIIHQNKLNNLSDTLSNPRNPESLTQTTPTDRQSTTTTLNSVQGDTCLVCTESRNFSSRYSINRDHSQMFIYHSNHYSGWISIQRPLSWPCKATLILFTKFKE
jgi:hypothetical protein